MMYLFKNAVLPTRVLLALTAMIVLSCFGAGAAYAQFPTSEYRFGVGLGVPYGGFGLNGELQGESQIAPTIGIGSLFDAGLGWSIGAHYYLKPGEDYRHRGSRITLLFGTNTVIENDYGFVADTKSLKGITLGFGRQSENWNWDLLFEFSTSSAPVGYSESTGTIDFSFGRMF